MDDRVVITGAGIVSSIGFSPSELWEEMQDGKSGIKNIEGFDAEGFGCKSAAQVKGLNPADLNINPKDARIMDLHSYMLVKCARDAYLHASLDTASVPGEDIGFFAGMGMVDYNIEDLLPAVLKSTDAEGALSYDAFYSEGYNDIYPLWPLSMLNNISFCQAAINLGIRGENTVFSPHADSGVQAIAEGARTLLDMKSKVLLAGGVSEKVSPLSLARAHLCGVLNPSGDRGVEQWSPFSEETSGTFLGEGCAVLALELGSSAAERGVEALASVSGYGFAFEREGNFSGPALRAVSGAMRNALDCAGITPADIDLLIAHGDGTHADMNEIKAIHEIFAGRLDALHVFSSKGAIGLTHAAAPVIDIILGICMLKTGIVPPVVGLMNRNRSIGFNVVSGEPLKKDIKKIMINCRSYEGQAASIIIERLTE